jgi:hypothetical protein
MDKLPSSENTLKKDRSFGGLGDPSTQSLLRDHMIIYDNKNEFKLKEKKTFHLSSLPIFNKQSWTGKR